MVLLALTYLKKSLSIVGLGGFQCWYFVLKEVLDHINVKIYHGSAREWTRDPEAPLVSYIWE